MVALRSLTDDGELVPVILREQRARLRDRLCILCGLARDLCGCSEYEQTYDRRDYADDGEDA